MRVFEIRDLTLSRETWKHRRRHVWAGVALLVPLLGFLLVPLYGSIWQLFFGNTFSIRGWHGRLPEGFFVMGSNTANPNLWRLDLGKPLFDVPYGHISIFSAGSGLHQVGRDNLERFAQSTAEQASSAGFVPTGRDRLAVDQTFAFCLQFTSMENRNQVQVRCILEGTGVFFYYEGHSKYRNNFYSFIRELRGGGQVSL